jgi:two-component system, OmpR family, sensor histidine kinase VicK
LTGHSNETITERTEIWYGKQKIMSRGLAELSKVKVKYDSILDGNGPSIIINNEFVTKAYTQIKARGGRLRLITEITKANLSYCKELAKYAELRHLDGVKGNLGIVDGISYGAAAKSEKKQFPTEYIYSTVKSFVEQQQYFFDMLWKRSIPAEQKIKELEEGIEPEVIETIRDPTEIQKLGNDLVELANEEILILFSSARAFYRQDRVGRIDALIRAVLRNPNVKIKILTPMIETINKQALQKLSAVRERNKNRYHIDVRQIESSIQTRATVLIIDRKYSLIVELKDDEKDESSKAVGLATYSNSGPTVLSYASIFESLWMQNDLYQRIKEANTQLEVHQRLQQEFINIAAHELRNPIQPILSLSEIVRGSEADEEKKDLLDVVVRNARRLRQLTEDVLDVTRIESNSLQLNKEEFNLEDLALHVIHDCEISTEGRVKLVFDQDNSSEEGSGKNSAKIGPITADKHRIQQVLSNLINNAVKYTEEGSTVLIKIRTNDSKVPNNGSVTVSVRDTGSGLDPAIMPRLFSKFATSNKGIGMGLGLYISKSIVEAHGGEIWAENNKSEGGATFYFRLPLR